MNSDGQAFNRCIVEWQGTHGRHDLPWQNTRDPYRVWLSEIMLQQTQVATVRDYFARFVARFPDVQALADASADDVLALWSGLGYYSRARNLHRCAQEVMARHGGVFPGSAEQLQTLPGIGRSTAAAIAAFCFGERVAILDANVKRVLTRLLAFGDDLAVAAHERRLWDLATDLLPTERLREAMPSYTQGLMDLGATVCTPRKPMCMLCPVQCLCAASRQGSPESYPVRTRKLRRTAESWWLLLLRDAAGRLWLERRPAPGIWAGLYCPPVAMDRAGWRLNVNAHACDLPSFTHVLTHKDLHLHPLLVDEPVSLHAGDTGDGGGWYATQQWEELGLPAPVRKLLRALPTKS